MIDHHVRRRVERRHDKRRYHLKRTPFIPIPEESPLERLNLWARLRKWFRSLRIKNKGVY